MSILEGLAKEVGRLHRLQAFLAPSCLPALCACCSLCLKRPFSHICLANSYSSLKIQFRTAPFVRQRGKEVAGIFTHVLVFALLPSHQGCSDGGGAISILQMRKLRLRDVKAFV